MVMFTTSVNIDTGEITGASYKESCITEINEKEVIDFFYFYYPSQEEEIKEKTSDEFVNFLKENHNNKDLEIVVEKASVIKVELKDFYNTNEKLKEKIIKEGLGLDVGSGIMVKRFGKYMPNMVFIIPNEMIRSHFKYELAEEEEKVSMCFKLYKDIDKKILSKANIEYKGEVIGTLSGNYRKNSKGTDVFELNLNGKDVFVEVGCDRNDYVTENEEFKFYKRAFSNGGGIGSIYVVMDKNFKNKINIDKI